MKKHPFLDIEFHSTIRLSPAERRQVDLSLATASKVFETLVKENIIKGKKRSEKRYLVSLLICGDQRIRKLNKEYRAKDKVTDVLSFPAQEDLRANASSEDIVHLGDLAISLPQAKRQAKKFSISTMDEFIHLFFHGVIHLLGYDHETSSKEEKLMERWEERSLELFSAKKKGA